MNEARLDRWYDSLKAAIVGFVYGWSSLFVGTMFLVAVLQRVFIPGDDAPFLVFPLLLLGWGKGGVLAGTLISVYRFVRTWRQSVVPPNSPDQ